MFTTNARASRHFGTRSTSQFTCCTSQLSTTHTVSITLSPHIFLPHTCFLPRVARPGSPLHLTSFCRTTLLHLTWPDYPVSGQMHLGTTPCDILHASLGRSTMVTCDIRSSIPPGLTLTHFLLADGASFTLCSLHTLYTYFPRHGLHSPTSP